MSGTLTVTGPNKKVIRWSDEDEASIEEAIRVFNESVEKYNMRAFSEVTKEPVSGFDPTKEEQTKVLIIPPMAGGR